MWVNTSSLNNEEIVLLQEEEEEEEETLSLCDLPNNEENYQTRKLESPRGSVTQEDFNFCSFLRNSALMCTADEVFFQGQILPLGHSNNSSSDSQDTDARGGDTCNEASSTEYSSSENHTLQLRTESMVHCSSYKPWIRNQFHSQPSPTAQVRFSKITHRNINSYNRKSTIWSLFRVGLVTTPEIALQDLKIRCNKNFDVSRNSTSSNSSSSSNDDKMRIKLSKKKKQRIFERKRVFLGSCKSSVNAVELVPSKVVTINRGSTNCNEVKRKTKQKISSHQTFEWLKQLSLENPAEET
ncbi:uncharacterized protein LOC132043892 [Lycium ferocissimum]|uniref:uncharacterized protein LOC132043892 n=1 Tax=Lycium ferocissimum TaxID=112874 RepID=UPI002815040F|nr:uncharacterized protein LOC132043892 [Lycium ferocissimum]